VEEEIVAVPWAEESAGADDQGIGVDCKKPRLGLSLATSISAGRRRFVRLDIRSPCLAVEHQVGRKGHERNACGLACAAEQLGSGGIDGETLVELLVRLPSAHEAGRVDHGPRSVALQCGG